MAGSGTTLVESALTGRTPWGADLDPLARLIAQAKTNVVPHQKILDAGHVVERVLARRIVAASWRPNLPDLDKWFRRDVIHDLARLKTTIPEATDDAGVRTLMWAVFSSLIVARTSVANARDLVHSRHHFRSWPDSPQTVKRFLLRLRKASLMMKDYEMRLIASNVRNPRPCLVGRDVRRLPIKPDTVDLIFTSPPYCSALDYTRAHVFAVAWLADVLDITTDAYRELGRTYIGSERASLSEASASRPLPPALGQPAVDAVVSELHGDPRRAWIVYRYFRDMQAVLRECGRVMRPGGRAVFVVCPSNIRKIPVPTHDIFALMVPETTGDVLPVEELHQRTIHDHRRVMPYIEQSFGPRMRTEYVLVLRREATGKMKP